MAFLKAFGSWLPERVVTSEEAASWVGTDAQWVKNVSGILERRFAGDGETVADLAARAGADCLERAGALAESVKMLLVSSGSAERQFPGPASAAAQKLGLGDIPAIDLPLASAGSLFAMSLASRLAEQVGEILVIGAEKMSRLVACEPRERGVAVLFGDGAGACLVSPESGMCEVVDSQLGSDGQFSDDLYADAGAPIRMNGRSVILQASRKIPGSIRTVLERHGILPEQVSAYLMHQANQNLIVRIAEALGVPSERFYSNIERYGNTSSASMLIAAAEWCREHTFTPGEPVVFAGFGAGFHWGALLARAV
jgi:3-oxoacyl-[acyl-carrier-protein] synthase III